MLSIAIGEVIKIPPSVKMVVSSHKVARVANLRFFHKVISRISERKSPCILRDEGVDCALYL